MSHRATVLAIAFEAANDDVIVSVESCSDDQLRAICADEGWPVVVVAHHLATTYPAIVDMVQRLVTGQPLPPLTGELLDAVNARHAEEFADVSREEALQALRREGSAAAELVRRLNDEQLDRTGPALFANGELWSAEQMVRGLIAHPIEHGRSIRATLSRQSARGARGSAGNSPLNLSISA